MGNFSDDELSPMQHGVSIVGVAALLDKLMNEKSSPRRSPLAARTEEPEPTLRIPQLGRFDSSRCPQICLSDYLDRLKKFGHFDTSLLVAAIYIDRLLAADSNFTVTNRNVHRLFLTCVVVAEKFHNDSFYHNEYYAGVGGIKLGELNRLEVTLLYALMWRLDVSEDEYLEKEREMELALDAASSAPRDAEWVVVREAASKKPRLDTRSESSSQPSGISGSEHVSDQASTASGGESASDSDEIMTSSSDVDA
jgi:hypothetical protein